MIQREVLSNLSPGTTIFLHQKFYTLKRFVETTPWGSGGVELETPDGQKDLFSLNYVSDWGSLEPEIARKP